MRSLPALLLSALALAACASTDHRDPSSSDDEAHFDSHWNRVYHTPYLDPVSDADVARAGVPDFVCKIDGHGGSQVFTAKWDRDANCHYLTTNHTVSAHCLVKIEGQELTYGLIKGRDNTGATELIRIHLHGAQSQIDDSDGVNGSKFYQDATCKPLK